MIILPKSPQFFTQSLVGPLFVHVEWFFWTNIESDLPFSTFPNPMAFGALYSACISSCFGFLSVYIMLSSAMGLLHFLIPLPNIFSLFHPALLPSECITNVSPSKSLSCLPSLSYQWHFMCEIFLHDTLLVHYFSICFHYLVIPASFIRCSQFYLLLFQVSNTIWTQQDILNR